MPDLGDIPVLARGAIPGAAGGANGAPDGARPGPVPGLVWLEDGLEEVPSATRARFALARGLIGRPDAPIEHLRPRDHHEEDEPRPSCGSRGSSLLTMRFFTCSAVCM